MLSTVLKKLNKYLELGTQEHYGRETNQKVFVSNLFSFIGYVLTIIMSLSAYYRGDFELSFALGAASAVFFFSHQVHRFPRLGDTIKISLRIVFVGLSALLLYLIYDGGNANTGPLWVYILPPIAFFFSGLKTGLINIGLFVFVMSVMFFFPHDALLSTSYSFEFKTRIIYSFLTVSVLFGFYEYSRQQSFRFIQELSEKFERQAMRDPLTHLPNRRGMRSFLEHEYNRSRRENTPLSILLVDIDKFKKINDDYLHDGGDKVLESLSTLFSSSIRSQDKVARWGGEEFLFLLPNTNQSDAFVLAEKIRTLVMQHEVEFAGQKISTTISIGLNEIRPGVNIDQAINTADHHLYEAKNKGRNQTQPVVSR
jgi:diguanylate cyclase (GGDEF)-like protein